MEWSARCTFPTCSEHHSNCNNGNDIDVFRQWLSHSPIRIALAHELANWSTRKLLHCRWRTARRVALRSVLVIIQQTFVVNVQVNAPTANIWPAAIAISTNWKLIPTSSSHTIVISYSFSSFIIIRWGLFQISNNNFSLPALRRILYSTKLVSRELVSRWKQYYS